MLRDRKANSVACAAIALRLHRRRSHGTPDHRVTGYVDITRAHLDAGIARDLATSYVELASLGMVNAVAALETPVVVMRDTLDDAA